MWSLFVTIFNWQNQTRKQSYFECKSFAIHQCFMNNISAAAFLKTFSILYNLTRRVEFQRMSHSDSFPDFSFLIIFLRNGFFTLVIFQFLQNLFIWVFVLFRFVNALVSALLLQSNSCLQVDYNDLKVQRWHDTQGRTSVRISPFPPFCKFCQIELNCVSEVSSSSILRSHLPRHSWF